MCSGQQNDELPGLRHLYKVCATQTSQYCSPKLPSIAWKWGAWWCLAQPAYMRSALQAQPASRARSPAAQCLTLRRVFQGGTLGVKGPHLPGMQRDLEPSLPGYLQRWLPRTPLPNGRVA